MKQFYFKTFFICEDMQALDRALKLKAALVDNCRGRGLIQASFYAFARLCHPQLRETAAKEAAAADMLVFSSSGKNSFPLFVQNWLAEIVPGKNKMRCVVSIQPDSTDEAGRQFLERWSNQKGAAFFSNDAATSKPGNCRVELNRTMIGDTAMPAWFT